MKEKWRDQSLTADERARYLINQMTLKEKASQLLHESPAVERLGIPAYNWWNECLHGVARAGRATVFPQAIGLAASFDRDLLVRVAEVISDEGRAKHKAALAAGNRGQYRGLTFWTPNVNIFRDPRWGRGQETYGEDPWLTSEMGLAFVEGLQQEKEGILKAAACAKHFAVHSGPEALRHEFDAVVSEQDLRATYLPAFKALVQKGRVEAVMGAYNRTNGEVCCGSKTLLQDILREEWGFEGHVVSDCWAVRDFHEFHRVTEGPAESVALAISNGCDLNCGCTYEFALEAVEKGLLSEKSIDESLFRLLVCRIRLGLFDEPGQGPWDYLNPELVDSREHRQLAREAAESSVVLLKNNGVLPLGSSLNSLYVTGPNASNPSALYGNYYGLNSRMVTFLEGIAGLIPEGVTVDYRPGALIQGDKPNPVDWAVFESASADVTLAFMGLDNSLEGEEGDAIASPEKGDRTSCELPESQLIFLRKLKEKCQKLVVVINTGSAVSMPEVHDLADALIVTWYPGEEAGNAVARILFGHVNPSGALPVTFYNSTADLPAYEDYSMKGRTYRYCTKEVLYPFGFGLSYTSFEFRDSGPVFPVYSRGSSLVLECEVVNTGTKAGAVPVQLYLTPPENSENLPRHVLRGLQKIELKPGESRKLQFRLSDDDFLMFDRKGCPCIPSGEWSVSLGNCSPGLRGEALGAVKALKHRISVT